jgi:polyhydroxyalkanoate synthase
MVNPPAANKYGYWTNEKLPGSAEGWFEGAKQHEGSWWTDWLDWLEPYLGGQVAAREVGKGSGKNRSRALEPAPGTYARQRADTV